MKNELGNLAEPTSFQNPISISNLSVSLIRKMLVSMMTIRKAEHQLALGRKNGLIGGPVHLGAGQEAIAVGVSQSLRSSDRVFGAHRSHSHLLALNPDVYRLFAEVLGKATGFSKGMGGSMHLFDQPSGFYGSVPIMAGTVPLAVGAAMAAKLSGTDDVGVAYIGDGAVEEGVVHESLNLAKTQNAPALFVIENNLFASHMHISLRQPSNRISRFAIANEIPHDLVDGNDVTSVFRAAKKQIEDIRSGKGPRLLELVTYRWYGHVDWRDDVDVGVERSNDNIEAWKAKDPIARLYQSMLEAELTNEATQSALNERLDLEVARAWEEAMGDPYPESNSTLKHVYSAPKQLSAEQ